MSVVEMRVLIRTSESNRENRMRNNNVREIIGVPSIVNKENNLGWVGQVMTSVRSCKNGYGNVEMDDEGKRRILKRWWSGAIESHSWYVR